MPRVSVVTLGCPKNAVDSEGLAGLVRAGGHEIVADPGSADVVVVNTCGFIDPARRETVEEVIDLADLKASGLRGLVLTGCLVARSADDLADALPEVDALVDFAAYPRIAEIVDGAAAGSLEARVFGDPGTRFDPAWWDAAMAAAPRLRFGRAPWAYLKIAEGCDRGCTFCSIPLMRGRLVSRPPEAIVAEARRLAGLGVSELSLVSQDSVMWGRDIGAGGVRDLLRLLEEVDGIRRIRLMYLHPHGVDDDLVAAICGSDKIATYFDLSLQHVSARVLRAMGRWGSRDRFERLVGRIRALDPNAGVRATFILGFPGESEEDAAEVEEFVATADLDWVGVFTYSREEGTRSYGFDGHVDPASARARAEAVVRAAELTMEARARALHGAVLDVLVERFDPSRSLWTGRSAREAPEVDGDITFSASGGIGVGDYVAVRITGNAGADLSGCVVGAAAPR